jgi:radical SAM protein with 4Fe4S-binding SPASM domain
MVQVNGDVTTCCLDEQLVNKIGNLTKQPLNEIWNSDRMNSWRMAQIEGRFEDSGPLCTKCNWRSAGGYPEREAAKWKQEWESKNGGHSS